MITAEYIRQKQGFCISTGQVRLIVQIADCQCNPVLIEDVETKVICLKNPANNVSEHVARIYTDGSDGKIYIETELDQAGTWQIQGQVSNTEGYFFSSEPEQFEVAGVICN